MMLAAQNHIERRRCSFELYDTDFMLAEDMSVWSKSIPIPACILQASDWQDAFTLTYWRAWWKVSSKTDMRNRSIQKKIFPRWRRKSGCGLMKVKLNNPRAINTFVFARASEIVNILRLDELRIVHNQSEKALSRFARMITVTIIRGDVMPISAACPAWWIYARN